MHLPFWQLTPDPRNVPVGWVALWEERDATFFIVRIEGTERILRSDSGRSSGLIRTLATV